MNKRHDFLFEGGGELHTMAATWFVSYMWYNVIDREHNNWKLVSTYKNRISVYNRTKEYHKIWLKYISKMKVDNLNRNSIGLKGEMVIDMAVILYNRF